MTRLFVAINISEELKQKVLEVQKKFSGFHGIKIVEKENFHLTLKFLGEVAEDGRSRSADLLPAIHNSVKEVSERIKTVTEKFSKFKISIEGLSFFTPPKNIRVIFLDLKDGKGKVVEIEKALNEKLRDFREEDYDPRPHLTIARVGYVKEKEKLLEIIRSLEQVSIGEMEVNGISLMKSVLTRAGPVYAEVERFKLQDR